MKLADQLHAHLTEAAAKDVFHGVALVTRGMDTLYEGAFGLASRRFGVPNAMSTRFDTASLTKLFTCAAVLQQVDAGALSLSTPVIDFLELTDTTISRDVTVHHLLSHTSGIGDDAGEEAGEAYEDIWRDIPSYSIHTATDMLPQFIHKPANFAPGEGCRYNNVAYVLLGLCVDRCTAMAYREYVQQHVFAPAGMHRSGFFRMDGVEPDVADGTDPVTDDAGNVVGWRRNIYSYPPIGSPDGGAHVTAHDTRAFFEAFRTGVLCSPALVAEAFTPHALHSTRHGRAIHYGYCLARISDLGGEPSGRLRYVEKDGINVGVSALLRHYPSSDLTVVLLSNTMNGAWDPARFIDGLTGGLAPGA